MRSLVRATAVALAIAGLVAIGRSAQAFALLQDTAADREVRVRIDTTLGAIEIVVYPDAAPITTANLLKYVDGGSSC